MRNILKINMELIADLEQLQAASNILSCSFFIKEESNRIVPKIDPPIFRILNHSAQFLDIIQSEFHWLQIHTPDTPPTVSSQRDSSICGDSGSRSKDGMNSFPEDMPIDMRLSDSAFSTIMTTTPKSFGDPNLHGHELSVSLSILSTYCQLIHVYQALFIQLYQLLLMVPPDDAAGILLLPSLQFGKFHMNGTFTAKVQVLIELSFNMLGNIDQSLGISDNAKEDLVGRSSSAPYTPDNGSLACLRDHVVAREYMVAGRALKETMQCLQTFVKCTDDVGI